MKINLNEINNKHFKNILLDIASDKIVSNCIVGTEEELMDIQAKATKELLSMREGYTQFCDLIKEEVKKEESFIESFSNLDNLKPIEVPAVNISKVPYTTCFVHAIIEDTIRHREQSWKMTQILISKDNEFYKIQLDADSTKIYKASVEEGYRLNLDERARNSFQEHTKKYLTPVTLFGDSTIRLSDDFFKSPIDNISEIVSYLDNAKLKECSFAEIDSAIEVAKKSKKPLSPITNIEGISKISFSNIKFDDEAR